MSESVPCPFCGELMTPNIQFCVACGRGVTDEDIRNAGLKMGSGKAEQGRKFALAKKEYTTHRKMRSMFWSSAAVMAIVLVYYSVMKYGLNEEPWVKWEQQIRNVMASKAVTDPINTINAATDLSTAGAPSAEVAAAPSKRTKHRSGH